MASPKQIAANRANAKKSTGPRTPEGKAASRFNALKFGLTAQSLVLPNESADDFEALAVEYAARFNPRSPEQRFLVKSLVTNDWFTDRLNRAEPDIWKHDFATCITIGDEVQRGGAFIFQHYSRLRRCHSTLHRTFIAAMKELRAQGIQPLDSEPGPEAELGSFCTSSQPIPTPVIQNEKPVAAVSSGMSTGVPPPAAAQQHPDRIQLVRPPTGLTPVPVRPLEELFPKPSPATMAAARAHFQGVDTNQSPRRTPPKSPRTLPPESPRLAALHRAAPAPPALRHSQSQPFPEPEPRSDAVVDATSQPPPPLPPST